jgi:hypothetical protein
MPSLPIGRQRGVKTYAVLVDPMSFDQGPAGGPLGHLGRGPTGSAGQVTFMR